MVATIHMGLFKFELIKMKKNLKLSSSLALATFQVLDSYAQLVGTYSTAQM